MGRIKQGEFAMKLIGAFAASFLTLCWAAASHAETIKVGVVLPYSGPNSDLGNQVDKAFDLYVKLHAKDLGDNKIELVKRDEGPASGANARTVVTELITNDKVKLLAGFVFSPSAIAAAPLATQAKIPMLIANAGTAWITNLSPYIVRFSFSMWDPAYPMGTYAATKLGCKTAAAGFTDFPPGQDSTLAFKTAFEKAGGKVVDEVRMGSPGPGARFHAVLPAREGRASGLLLCLCPLRLARRRRDEDLWRPGHAPGRRRLIGPMDLIPDYQLAHMSDAAIGLIVMSSYSDDLDTPGNKEFVKAWHEAYGPNSYPDFMSAASMDTMAGIFDVINTLHGNLDDGAKVIDTLKGWKHEGFRGPIEIDPQTRDVIQPERAEEVIKKADGKLGVKVLETYPQVKDECKELKVGRCVAAPRPEASFLRLPPRTRLAHLRL
jgi:branched-chain amino acid transport system substrate-binding protein